MEKIEVQKTVNKLHRIINNRIKKGNTNSALMLISICANILYQTNIFYRDEVLEDSLKSIANYIDMERLNKEDENTDDIVLFWDGFGLNNRGLILIYLKAICKKKNVIYITYSDRREKIPDIIRILEENGCGYKFVDRIESMPLSVIRQLNEYFLMLKPKRIFFYSTPDDVIATTLMYAYADILERYIINITDHAFWLGAGCIDHCIEFREYGARISFEYRNIPQKNICIIPFYPIIDYDRNFEGYPFETTPEQIIVFSGGALYKTFGDGNKYYEIIEHILEKYDNLIFWYAGEGDKIELEKIIKKYPERVFVTAERVDLFQVMEHIDIYLSTYPICGGLMFQYAAVAGVVPVTLKYDEISDGFMLNQPNIGIEYLDLDGLYSEIDRLITDKDYANMRSEEMKNSIMKPSVFEAEVNKLLEKKENMMFKPIFTHIETGHFRDLYLDRIKDNILDEIIINKNTIKFLSVFFPIRLLRRCINYTRRNK